MPQKSHHITFIGQQLSCITHGNVYSVFCVCQLIDQCNSGGWVVAEWWCLHITVETGSNDAYIFGRVFGLFKADVSVAVVSLVSNQIRWKREEGRERSSWGWFLRGCRVTTSNLLKINLRPANLLSPPAPRGSITQRAKDKKIEVCECMCAFESNTKSEE